MVLLGVALLLAIPGLWVLGLDQGAWLAVGACLGFAGLAGIRERPVLPALLGAFFAVAALSGILGAQGERWITLTRELLIVATFAGAIVGMRHLGLRSASGGYLVAGLAFVMTVSAIASLFAAVTQTAATFDTPLAPVIPSEIADTRLGAISFVDRALGTSSYFLGQIFLRPQGLFLFSTSQAVAQTAAIPLFLAAAQLYRSARWWLVGAAVISTAALLATTTRVPIAGLIVSFAIVWLVKGWMTGSLLGRVPLNVRVLPAYVAVLVASLGIAYVVGLADVAWQLVTTRSLDPRAALYGETIAQWMRQPILGWGTEVDWTPSAGAGSTVNAVGLEALPPLGSHSQYLGVLFKQGLLGAGLFLGIVALVGRRAWAGIRSGGVGASLLAVAFLATLFSALTESLWLDPAAAVAVGVAWGAVTATRNPPSGDGSEEAAS